MKTWRHKDGSVRVDHMDAQPGDYYGTAQDRPGSHPAEAHTFSHIQSVNDSDGRTVGEVRWDATAGGAYFAFDRIGRYVEEARSFSGAIDLLGGFSWRLVKSEVQG